MSAPTALSWLPCPECRSAGRGTARSRIGGYKNGCAICNRFTQRVMNRTWKVFRERYPQEHARIRAAVELDLYALVMEQFAADHPAT